MKVAQLIGPILSIVFSVLSIHSPAVQADSSQTFCTYQYYSIADYTSAVGFQLEGSKSNSINILEGLDFSEYEQQQEVDLAGLEVLFWESPENPELFALERLKQIAEKVQKTAYQGAEIEFAKEVEPAEQTLADNKVEKFTTPDFDYYDYVSTAQSSLNVAILDGVASYEETHEQPANLYIDDSLQVATRTVQVSINPELTTPELDLSSDEYLGLIELQQENIVTNADQQILVRWQESTAQWLYNSIEYLGNSSQKLTEQLVVEVKNRAKVDEMVADLESIEQQDRLNQHASDYRGKIIR